ncbi:MAG TPA: radical SAM protein [Candidatus Binatia bacterium]|jgi:MoaA/NifB/PqqE/SkfB family radical SAM enzyme
MTAVTTDISARPLRPAAPATGHSRPAAAATGHPGSHPEDGRIRRYDDAPRRVYWELTRACALACKHCRAEALHQRLPGELSTEEAFDVLRSLATARPTPAVVLTGGDPLERPDFWEILDFAKSLGLHVDVAPSATPKLTREVILELARRGVGAMSLSLDGSDPPRHDALRGIPGCFELTMKAAAHIAEAGIALQVNTLVTADTLADMPAIAERVRDMKAKRWSLFFLVTTGRGSSLPQIEPAQAEELLHWVAAQRHDLGLVTSATEAPMVRRVMLEMRGQGPDAAVAGAGMRDGNGILFVSWKGEVMPSGFLPVVAGSVRERDILDIYRNAPLLRDLRRPELFGGRCGVCCWNEVCGGSRGRAYAATGDALAEDPLCVYQPPPRPQAGDGCGCASWDTIAGL